MAGDDFWCPQMSKSTSLDTYPSYSAVSAGAGPGGGRIEALWEHRCPVRPCLAICSLSTLPEEALQCREDFEHSSEQLLESQGPLCPTRDLVPEPFVKVRCGSYNHKGDSISSHLPLIRHPLSLSELQSALPLHGAWWLPCVFWLL